MGRDDVGQQQHSDPCRVIESSQEVPHGWVTPVGLQRGAQFVELVDDSDGAEVGARRQQRESEVDGGVEAGAVDVDADEGDAAQCQ
ncbi:hypothetical protein ACFYW6_22645 [Streptomyces sp. NPDC002659]|uniref:hypothetical protein n=1 Tax=Streptomyces sp. NPDC002659 TaxID=3364656 RepID=UPI0036B79015